MGEEKTTMMINKQQEVTAKKNWPDVHTKELEQLHWAPYSAPTAEPRRETMVRTAVL